MTHSIFASASSGYCIRYRQLRRRVPIFTRRFSYTGRVTSRYFYRRFRGKAENRRNADWLVVMSAKIFQIPTPDIQQRMDEDSTAKRTSPKASRKEKLSVDTHLVVRQRWKMAQDHVTRSQWFVDEHKF